MKKIVILIVSISILFCAKAQRGNHGGETREALNSWAKEASKIPMTGYPNLQIQAGWSVLLEEFIGVQAEVDGMGGWYGGFMYSLNDTARIPWWITCGYYGGNELNTFYISALTDFADNYYGIGIQYSRFFSFHRRLGFYVAWDVFGFPDENNNIFVYIWDFRFGITYRLFAGKKK